jgi:hypothetical protein
MGSSREMNREVNLAAGGADGTAIPSLSAFGGRKSIPPLADIFLKP